jgi:hypothetical protein
MDATRYALQGELGEAARTEASLAAMQSWRTPGRPEHGDGPSVV